MISAGDPLDLLDEYGCEQCDSTQTLTPDRVHHDIFWLKVRHAAGCAFIAKVRASRFN